MSNFLSKPEKDTKALVVGALFVNIVLFLTVFLMAAISVNPDGSVKLALALVALIGAIMIVGINVLALVVIAFVVVVDYAARRDALGGGEDRS